MAKVTTPTLNDISKERPSYRSVSLVFVVLVFALLLVPFVAMVWAPTQTTTENRELAPCPQLINDDGSFNVNFLSDAGSYFKDHYAYKNQLVDIDAHLYSAAFDVSVADNVVYGENDWLYYAGTLGDTQNRTPLRERQTYNIAHNVKMLQDWCQSQGANFVFTIAPNKSGLYDENMPYYYPSVENDSMQKLSSELGALNVNYVNLFDIMKQAEQTEGEPVYFLRDSHWNEKGALYAHDALADALNWQNAGFQSENFTLKQDYIGDLNTMLYPVSAKPEKNYYMQGVNDGSGKTQTQRSGQFWNYTKGNDPNDATVVTNPSESNPYADVCENNGQLLAYRDSFAIGLLSYFACESAQATFDKMVPYDGLQLLDNSYSAVIVERAQRHASDLADDAFIMPCPTCDVSVTQKLTEDANTEKNEATCKSEHAGSLIKLSGTLDANLLDTRDNIYVQLTDSNLTTRTYEAFLLNGTDRTDNAYAAYVGSQTWEGKEVTVNILVGSQETANSVASFKLSL